MPLRDWIATSRSGPRTRYDLPCSVAYLVAFFSVLVFFLVRPFCAGVFWMKYMQDDFFYYLKVAQNIADGHGSTFGGIARTNGYHPLFELLLIGFSYVARSPHSILALQAVLIFIASVATMLLSIHLLQRLQVRLLTATAFSSWVVIYALRIFYNGMEVTLTIPLALAFLAIVLRWTWWTRSFRHSLLLGLLGSLVVLSRLDSLVFIALVFAGILAAPSLRAQLQRSSVLGVLLGLQPITLYVLLNRIWFDTLLPVSGMAKQLKPGLFPSAQTWTSLNLHQPAYLGVASPILVAIVLLPWAWRAFQPLQRCVLVAGLFFPWVYYFIICCASDWGLWSWYLYPLRIGILVSCAVFCGVRPLGRLLQTTGVTAALCVLLFLPLFADPWRIQLPELYDRAVEVETFASTHPGTYAMGDGAGAVGYLLHEPFVQLEGLMMDRAYLEYLRRQTPLRDLLAAYKVDYYVATYYRAGDTNFLTDRSVLLGNCLSAIEPALAGPTSPKSRGRFCETPVFHSEHLGTHTVIYRVGPGATAGLTAAPSSRTPTASQPQ